MDSESLKIILNLSDENLLMKRTILSIAVMLKQRKMFPVQESGISEISCL